MIYLVTLTSLCSLASAQTPAQAPTKTDAEQSFDQLKTLAGSWQGSMDGKPVPLQVTLRVTSMGNTLMHEMKSTATPDDPISMFTIDGDRLRMTHYCDAGNQPHMVATVSPDGKTFTFDFVDATNLRPSQVGHMQHVVFNLIDADHHTELWQFAMADGKPMGGLLDLHRTK
jgi:hypothetical protein